MNAGVTFARVYRALKDQLGSGRHGAGEHLEPAVLSQDLNASITPVRDALHRLAGEGLVETPRADGFRTPIVTEVGLRHLYRWNAALLGLAVRGRSGPPPVAGEGGEEAAGGPVEATERLFLAVATRADNPEHVAAVARLNERLRPIRHTEVRLLGDPQGELEEIAAHFAGAAASPLRRSLAAYHARRQRIVAETVAALVGPR